MGKCQSACGNACGRENLSVQTPSMHDETAPKEQATVALLDHYRLGPILGEGAFGVVAVCMLEALQATKLRPDANLQ